MSLFVIQKSFNKNSAQEHLKRNELISSHKPANNPVIDTSQKTEKEIQEMSKEYIETDDSLEKELDNDLKKITIENKI
ncbi:MAG: low affinity iron permease family protein [Flavobacterium sp.]|nr:low affinity iron permease family protein [Flavobacterium sp.]